MSREKILVLCRAIPEESRSYFNTVCVAGITDKGEWRRLYPIPVKPFVKDAGIPFHKRDWIEADVSKPNNDKRFESRKIDMSSVKVIAKATYAEVREFITPFIKPSIASIENGGASLGLIKPRILGFDCRVIDTDEWDKSQVDLNGNPKGKIKLGQKSAYTFVCEETKSCSCANNPHAIDVHD